MTDQSLKRTLALIMAVLVLAACGSDKGLDPQGIEFVDDLQIDLSATTLTPSGLYFQDLTVGDGAVAGRFSPGGSTGA